MVKKEFSLLGVLKGTVQIASLAVLVGASVQANAQTVLDDFEGNGIVPSWVGDDCTINASRPNPVSQGINTSATVLEYHDLGGIYANTRFEMAQTFDMSSLPLFRLKVYVPSTALTGNQPNQISFKLQDGTLGAPWSTQTEIIKPIILDQWQEVTFDFQNDAYINLDANSPAPVQRIDLNRAVIQVNGENNADHVLAYIDDITNEPAGMAPPINSQFNILVWADEFDVDGPVDPTKWYHQTQFPWGNSWFNNEVQHYTDRTDNSYVDNGTLKIVGKQESFTDQGVTKQFTSARLNSKFAFQYGRVEARAKMPFGNGTWPAIWLLGKNISESGAYWETQGYGTTPWPDCGEIDIMEHWGSNQNYVSSATHTPSSFGGTVNIGGQTIPTVSTDFHVYAMEWTPDYLEFTVDGIQHFVYSPAVQDMNTWPFDAEMYLLLNFAILPSISSNYTQDEMELDYIRVYQDSAILASVPEIGDHAGFDMTSFPNPASESTTISYTLPHSANVLVEVRDLQGRLIETLLNERQLRGKQIVQWNTIDQPAGVYYCSLKTDGQAVTHKVAIKK